jgi:hypothetical protein
MKCHVGDALHPNDVSRLREEILLLKPSTSSSIGVAQNDDHMHDIVPSTIPPTNALQEGKVVGENPAQNGALDPPQSSAEK